MTTLLIAVPLVVVAILAALVIRRRQPEPPTQRKWSVPGQLDRADFDRPEAEWLVVVFTSKTCESCESALAKVAPLASADVVVQDVSYQTNQKLQERYGIDAAPTIVVADREGVVKASFIGAPSTAELWTAVADVRAGGTGPMANQDPDRDQTTRS
jgi:protein-disulfide isomerase